MADPKNVVKEGMEQTPEVSTTSKVETQATVTPSSGEEVSKETSVKSSTLEDLGGETQEKKSRLEKRIEQLEEKAKTADEEGRKKIEEVLGKLKAIKEQKQSFIPPSRPLFSESEYEIDPQEFERRLVERELQLKEQAKAEMKAELAYHQALSEHLQDVENVKKEVGEDKELAEILAEQYNHANTVYNPLTGEKVFVPRKKMSEIYQQVKKMIDKVKTKTALDVTGQLSEQAKERPVPPTGDGKGEADIEQLRKELWKNPSKVASYLESRLPKSQE